jgi:cell division protein ZapA (FtsZ GTPase activity inhibitor)
MKVLINPSETESGSGLASTIAWNNPDVLAGLNVMFNIQQRREKIVQIEITQDGITARLESTRR